MGQIELLREGDHRALQELLGEIHASLKRESGLHAGSNVPATSTCLRWLATTCTDGALAYYEGSRLVGVCFAHLNGREGWLGPFGVLYDDWSKGVGKELLHAGLSYLLQRHATTVGLEGPAAPWLLGFLGRAGFSPYGVTLTLEIPVDSLPTEMDFWVDAYSGRDDAGRRELDLNLSEFFSHAALGRDYKGLVTATAFMKIGETLIFSENDQIVGVAVVHKEPFYEGEGEDAASVHTLVCHTKRNVGRLDQLITAAGAYARVNERRRLRLQCPSDDPVTYQYLLSRGFRVVESRLRLNLEGYPARRNEGFVIFSNWQI